MLKEGYGIKKVYLRAGYTDMRKGIDGLAALVEWDFGLDPTEPNTLFLFCGRSRDRIKALLYEGDGYVLMTKRLSDGKYQWPRNTDEAMRLDLPSFKRLMEGYTVESSIRIPKKPETGAKN